MSSEKPLYLRARRDKTVLFLCYQAKDSIATIKERLCSALQNNKSPNDVRLYTRKQDDTYTLLNDNDDAIKAGLQNGSDIYFVYQSNGDWEQVHTEQYQTLDDDETVEEIPVSKKEKGKGRA